MGVPMRRWVAHRSLSSRLRLLLLHQWERSLFNSHVCMAIADDGHGHGYHTSALHHPLSPLLHRYKVPWRKVGCLATAGFILLSSTSSVAHASTVYAGEDRNGESDLGTKKPVIIFVLGGPGCGKSTVSKKIMDLYGFTHLSAGELLRSEVKKGTDEGLRIHNIIMEGNIVPSEITVQILQKAMEESKSSKFVIDGFPRTEENWTLFQELTGIEPEFVLFMDCPMDVMQDRLRRRNQGRLDDNTDTIAKRIQVFKDSSLPVLNYFESRGKIRKIDASGTKYDVFDLARPLFLPYLQEEVLQCTKRLLLSIDAGDYETYRTFCASAMTSFEPEAQGHLVEGLDFHKFYFERKSSIRRRSEIVSPKVTLFGDDTVALVTYTRLCQREEEGGGAVVVKAFNETRIWERIKDPLGHWEWKSLHFHRSPTSEVY